ncbi:unnamed protein product [marine sediment metagenome]|uniref:Uncharacterized protein n=1 Tax=marine sediment metagenome TaxID=412755 RepID=X1CG01_9ZZZZ
MKDNVSKYQNELEKAVNKLQTEPLDELNVFNEPTFMPGYTRYLRITEANRLLLGIAEFLEYCKASLEKGASLETLKILINEKLLNDIIFVKAVELHYTVKLLENFLNLLSDISNEEEFAKVAETLAFYCRRVGPSGWIDTLYLHKSQMSLLFDLFFPITD